MRKCRPPLGIVARRGVGKPEEEWSGERQRMQGRTDLAVRIVARLGRVDKRAQAGCFVEEVQADCLVRVVNLSVTAVWLGSRLGVRCRLDHLGTIVGREIPGGGVLALDGDDRADQPCAGARHLDRFKDASDPRGPSGQRVNRLIRGVLHRLGEGGLLLCAYQAPALRLAHVEPHGIIPARLQIVQEGKGLVDGLFLVGRLDRLHVSFEALVRRPVFETLVGFCPKVFDDITQRRSRSVGCGFKRDAIKVVDRV